MKRETNDKANAIIKDEVTINSILNSFPSGAITVEPETLRALMLVFDQQKIADADINNSLTLKFNAFYYDLKLTLTTAQTTLTTKFNALQDAPDPDPEPDPDPKPDDGSDLGDTESPPTTAS